jgi:hypothetical protein
MSKNWVETEGPQMTSQYGVYALHAGLARLQALMPMHTIPGTHMHARTRIHAHTDQYVILIAFPHGNSAFANAPQCYVKRTLPVFFIPTGKNLVPKSSVQDEEGAAREGAPRSSRAPWGCRSHNSTFPSQGRGSSAGKRRKALYRER